MPENFSFVPDRKIDIRHIRNEVAVLSFDRDRKNHTVVFHAVYAVIAAFCIYLALSCPVPVVSYLGMFFGPSMLVYTFLYSPMPIKALSVLLPVLIDVFANLVLLKTSTAGLISHAFTFLLCILVASLLTKAVISGYGKTTCFVFVTAAYLLVILSIGIFLLIYNHGTFSISLAVETVDKFFDSLINSTVEYAKTPLGLDALRHSLPDNSTLSDEQLISSIKNTLEVTVPAIKLSLPAIVTVSCMILSFFTISAFSFVAKKMKINVFVCIMDDFWTYRPSSVTTMMYDIVFFLYIIATFVKLPQNVSITIVNLLFIMTPAMFVVGINGIYSFFRKKNMSKTACVVICTAITFASLTFIGMLGILIISSMGVMFVTARDREEMLILPIKLLEHKKICDEITGNKNNSENDSQNNGDSIE